MSDHCPECGAAWADGRTCTDDFHQLLFWENERPELGEVHHLMVLCYHLQHPGLYSAEGLAYARRLLAQFVEGGLSPEQVRQRAAVDSGQRAWSITARPGNAGSYERRPLWKITAADIVAGDQEYYVVNVWAWARDVQQALTAEAGRG